MTLPALISPLSHTSIAGRIGGLPLVVRHLKELHKLGVKTFYLDSATNHARSLTERLPRDITLHILPREPTPRAQQLRQLTETSEAILLLRGDWLIDPRLLAALITATHPIWLPSPASLTPQSQVIMVAARLSPKLTQQWMQADAMWLPHVPTLKVDTLDTYLPSHRGHKPFYLQAVTTPEEGVAATQALIQAAQKHTLDLPAQVLHPFFENRLVRWLCNTPITPNHVTLVTALLGACTALLFFHGVLGWGVLLAYLVAILDGVDGKLARTTLQTSRLGEVEHVIDFFVEQSWYFCLTLYLVNHTNQALMGWVGGVLMASDMFDKLLYMWGHKAFGKQLDELGPFERRFRLIGGRRNIYLWFFMLGFWSSNPIPAFIAASLWSLCTTLVHSARFLHHLRHRHAGGVPA
jgi:1L-myo-inositol 1-phosphate cytidylyltransferase / CDP-L-myo-inositol myo-inositolphosphotransferase